MINLREMKGREIVNHIGEPLAMGMETFLVPSQTSSKKYRVQHLDCWTCECPDFKYRDVDACKHIHAVQFWLKLRERIESNDCDGILQYEICPYCHSEDIVKRGIRKNAYTVKQRFSCKKCGKRFVIDQFKRFKGNGKTITLVMDLYFKGVSLRKIQDHLKQFYGMEIGHATIYRWIKKFMKLMNIYVNQLKPELSETWHIDEQAVKTKGKIGWSWNVLDHDTRFLIANHVSRHRESKDVKFLLNRAKNNVKANPKIVITDSLPAYKYNIVKEVCAKYIRARSLTEKRINNNLIERYHGTFRERDKVMRGFGHPKQARVLISGFRTYYNFIRPHTGIDGKTPAEKAGIDLNLGQNKWLGLIKLANSK